MSPLPPHPPVLGVTGLQRLRMVNEVRIAKGNGHLHSYTFLWWETMLGRYVHGGVFVGRWGRL